VIANLLSFPLVTHTASSNTRFDSYEFSKQTVVLNDSGQIGNWSKTSGLGYKMDEDQRDLIMNFAVNFLSFSTPTHTHESSNHNNGYGI
jgi:hypothetical protein